MRKLLLPLFILLSPLHAFPDDSYLALGGNVSLAGVGGFNFSYGGALDSASFPIISFEALLGSSTQTYILTTGGRWYLLPVGLFFGGDLGLGDNYTAGRDNYGFTTSGLVGLNIPGLSKGTDGISVAVKLNLLFAGSPQLLSEFLIDLSGGYSPTETNHNSSSSTVQPQTSSYRPRPPTAPFPFLSEYGYTTASIYWYDSYSATSYSLYRDGVLIYKGAFTYFEDNGLTPGRKYNYTIQASNDGGSSGQSVVLSVRTPEKRLLPVVRTPLAEPIVSSIEEATEWVNSHIEYDWAKARNDDYILLSPKQVLAAQSGVCRDMVVLTQKIVYDSLGVKARYVGIKIPGTPGHAILEFNGRYFDPTSLQTYSDSTITKGQVMSYDETMRFVSKQVRE